MMLRMRHDMPDNNTEEVPVSSEKGKKDYKED